MPRSSKVVDVLNDVLTAELTGINQYFIHSKMCQNWGYRYLYKKNREESIDEMKHADEIIERILQIGGVPNVQRLSKINVGETVPEQLKLDYKLEEDAIDRLNKGIVVCQSEGDHASRAMLEEILVSEEDHLDWLESQLTLIEQVGEQNYLAQQIHES